MDGWFWAATVQSYVRALFGYDPAKDSLLPCPEIGLPFKYGDVLQVSPAIEHSFLLESSISFQYFGETHPTSTPVHSEKDVHVWNQF